MKLICPLTNVSYGTSIGYGHGRAPHPVFYIPLKSLIQQHLHPYYERQLSNVEIHLFGCALLHKLPVIWEVPLDEAKCAKVWPQVIEKLSALCMRLDTRRIEEMPQYHITKDNNTLHNLRYYIESIDDTIEELEGDGDYRNTYIQRNAENTITRMLLQCLNKSEKKHALPKLMADWALEIGRFPTDNVTLLHNDNSTTKVPMCEHWHGIIMRIFGTNDPVDILTTEITAGDIEELIEHCETNIEVGTIIANALLRKLRDAKEVLDEFRSPASVRNIKIAETRDADALAILLSEENGPQGFKSVRINESAETTPTSAPTSEPLRKDYPSMGAYLAAKIKWQRGN